MGPYSMAGARPERWLALRQDIACPALNATSIEV
jgi:hypothetical protein